MLELISFSSVEELQREYNQLWIDMASFFTDIPTYFAEVLDFASKNPVAIIVVSLFIVMIAFTFIRRIITMFSALH